MWMSPIRSGLVDQKMNDYEGSMVDWHNFLNGTKTYYGVDMSVFTKPYGEEQQKYYLQVGVVNHYTFILDEIDNRSFLPFL